MKRYASICCKEAKGISHGAVPGLAARLTILLVIVLLVACGDGNNSSPNPDVPIPESSNADLVDLSIFATSFPPNPFDSCCDMNVDGAVGLQDLSLFAFHFGPPGHVCN